MKALILAISLLGFALPVAASGSTDQPRLYFVEPADGETVPREFRVVFGLTGMGVAPAGVERDNTGHHHLLIDVEQLPDLTQPLPANDNIRHFGGGQTETVLTLPPGRHTLQLLMGNHMHIPHQPPVISERITVIVE